MQAHPPRGEDRAVVEREVDIALGLVTAGMLAGRKAARAGLAPARVAYRSPLGASWRGVVTGLGDSGASTRRRGEAQLREAFDRALDRALAGPLTEYVARALGEHRVVERLASELIAQGTVTAVVEQALQAGLADEVAQRLLEHEQTETLVVAALESPGLERLLVRVLDSRLLLELTDRVIRSPEMEQVIGHIASSPELRAALAEQSSGLADEMVSGVRRRTAAMDDAAERTVRSWLRRPRPRPT
jgi:hypothetical protein